MGWLERWREHAAISEFSDLSERNDEQLLRVILAAMRSGDKVREKAAQGIRLNRRGLIRDWNK